MLGKFDLMVIFGLIVWPCGIEYSVGFYLSGLLASAFWFYLVKTGYFTLHNFAVASSYFCNGSDAIPL